MITYGIQFGEWIVNHTVVPFPVETTAVLLAANLAIWILAIRCRIRGRRRGMR